MKTLFILFKMTSQVFVIHRHGARYSIKKPQANVLWPTENKFWEAHAGKLSPVGVSQMIQIGKFIRILCPWINTDNSIFFSTKRSRALESLWSLILGALPNTAIKFNAIKPYKNCASGTCCPQNTACIHYYPKDDPLFGNYDESLAFKLNINNSSLLKNYTTDSQVLSLITKLCDGGALRHRRDPVTTVAKLKDIHGQLLVDSQLLPQNVSIQNHYQLSGEELGIIDTIGKEVICRRSVPVSEDVMNIYNGNQGIGLVKKIRENIRSWDGQNRLYVYSCHDTNIISWFSTFGLKIDPPDFAGFIYIVRTVETVKVYYFEKPFVKMEEYAKVWTSHDSRTQFVDWNKLPTGVFDLETFLRVCDTAVTIHTIEKN